MSRLHIRLKTRKWTAAGIMIHEIAHALLGHDIENWTQRAILPTHDPDWSGGPTVDEWNIFNEVEADAVTEACLDALGHKQEAELRRRRITAHYLIDKTQAFDEIIPYVNGIGPLVRTMGHEILPAYEEIQRSKSVSVTIATIVESVRRRELLLE